MSTRWMSPLDRARAAGAREAARMHARLGLDPHQRVDVFDVIERAGIWLMFQPLNNLFGVYYREGQAAGIVVNANHPLSVQRYTAAHELGHHVLGHAGHLDDERHIFANGATPEPQEAAAQAFAGALLMPLSLVNAVLRRLDLPPQPGQVTARQAYLLALELGVSYAAAVQQLLTYKKVTWAAAAELRREEPRTIKAAIGRGTRPEYPWAETWPLDLRDAGQVLSPAVRDELVVALPETPSTGYVWHVANEEVIDWRSGGVVPAGDAPQALAWVGDRFEPRAAPLDAARFGTGGTRRLIFRVLRPGHHRLRVVKRRPWLPDAAPTAVFEVALDVPSRWSGATDTGLSERQKPLLAQVV